MITEKLQDILFYHNSYLPKSSYKKLKIYNNIAIEQIIELFCPSVKKERLNQERIQKICDLKNSGKTFKEVGDIMELTRQRCHQIYQKYNIINSL